MKNKTNKKRTIKISKKELIIVCALLLAFVIGLALVNIYYKSQESKRVSNMVNMAEQYYYDQSNLLGLNASSDNLNKSCKPIDKMWNSKYKFNCSITATKTLPNIDTKEEATNTYDSLQKLALSQGLVLAKNSTEFGAPRISLTAYTNNYPKKNSKDIICKTAFLYDENANNPYIANFAVYELYCSVDLNNVPEGFELTDQ